MKQNYAIIGLGRFGGSICRTLIESGQEVLAIDSNEDRVNEYMNIATHAVVGNAQDEMTLRSLGIRNFDHVIVAIGEDIQASILVTLMVKEMGVPNVLAKAQNEYHARVLEKLGADRVVHPERDMGIRIAHNLVSKNILDYIELSDEFSLAEIRVSNPRFFNRSLLDLNFRQKYGLTVVAGDSQPLCAKRALKDCWKKQNHRRGRWYAGSLEHVLKERLWDTGKPLQFPRGAGQDERIIKRRLVSCPGGMLWYANAVGMGRIAFPFVYVPCYAPHRHIGKSDRIRECFVNSRGSGMALLRHAASFGTKKTTSRAGGSQKP